LANLKQAKKRARQAEKHRKHNASLRSMMRTSIKKLRKLIADGNKPAANEAFKETQSVLDNMARKGLIHKNNCARNKSRLNQHLKVMDA
jgi:small subunit ribosomal protein S20